MSTTLVISPAAGEDLRQIFRYGVANWGLLRATAYLEHIKEQLWSLIEHPLIGLQRNEILPGLRSLILDHHVVFYRLHGDQLQIVRVLHSRQDPQPHL